jgi:hypothetical protein
MQISLLRKSSTMQITVAGLAKDSKPYEHDQWHVITILFDMKNNC